MNERQQAEQFAALLEAHAAGGGADGRAAGSRESAPAAGLVALAERIEIAGRALPAPEADFRQALRARLVAEAPSLVAGSAAAGAGRGKSALPAQRAVRARTGARHSAEGRAGVFTGISASWRRRLLAAGVGVAVATGSVGGIAIASASAEPGDPLYSAKKIFESLQLSLSGSPTEQGRDYLHLADIRLGEIDSLLGRPDVDLAGSPTQAYLNQTIAELRTSISHGGTLLIAQVRADDDQTALHALADFLLTERQRVVDLSWRLPPDLQSQPPQIVALMDQLSRQLQLAAEQAASNQQGQQGAGVGEQGSGQLGQGGGPQSGPGTGSPDPGSTGSASSRPTGTSAGAGEGSASTGASSAGASTGSTASPGSTIGVNVPVPVLPSIGVTLPGLLGLPQIDVGLGGSDGSSTAPAE